MGAADLEEAAVGGFDEFSYHTDSERPNNSTNRRVQDNQDIQDPTKASRQYNLSDYDHFYSVVKFYFKEQIS